MHRLRRRSFRASAPWRVVGGFGGGATTAASRYAEPASLEALGECLSQARQEALPVTFRGAGRSYGDAAVARDGLVVDTQRINRILAWDPAAGVVDAEPGVTIEQLWRHTLADGYWPRVVPGTMRPTLAGCLAMNVHGKNNYKVGPIGESVVEFDLLTPGGETITCSPTTNADVFHAAIGGLGLLGAFTRVRLSLHRVESGCLRVEPLVAGSIGEMLDVIESVRDRSDYAVGWVDALARGQAIGRGVIHRAVYAGADEVPDARASLQPSAQDLPGRTFGVPNGLLWRFMQPLMRNAGVRVVNAVKYRTSTWEARRSYLQSHVAFAFLLDYVPDWRLAYGPDGFIQYQVFIPHDTARDAFAAILARCQAHGRPPYLGVLKRHRRDGFVLSHAVDGWSLAMDFKIGPDAAGLWRLTETLSEIVIEAGGRFYFAKDAVLRPVDVERAYGRDTLDRFGTIKRRLDPDGLLTSALWQRVTAGRRD
jgi:FAD/FMN-containing dehydrogenase